MSSIEVYLLSSAVLLILCVFASKATGRLGIPTLVVFLGVGILAGSEGIGGIQFDDAYAAQSLGIVALTYILFSGGLDTKWNSVRPVLKAGISLSTLGVLFTCLFVGVFIHYILHFSLLESFLIGAIISSTDAGAVFTVLRSKNINLKGHLKPLLELESGSNDPIAVFLTTTILQLMQMPRLKVTEMFPLLVQQMVLGAAIGFFLGRVLIFLYRRLKLEIEGLYLVFSIAAVMLIYSITQTLKGNGFLAVYIAGVVLGNDQFVLKKSLTLMHDGISWLMQSAMFLTLGLLIYPSKILNVAEPGILIAIFMILMARPLSVFLSLSFSKTSTREKALISWVGLRGSVPVIMATYPLVAGIDRAGLIFNIVFFVALSSLIIQGTSIHLVSKFLGVYDPHGIVNMNFSSIPGSLKEIVTIDIPLHSPVIGKSLVELHLPLKNILVVAIERKGEVIIPRGGSILREDDKLSLMADDEALADFMEIVWSKHSKIKTMFFWLPDMDK
jgi:cell volume regulation protein A